MTNVCSFLKIPQKQKVTLSRSQQHMSANSKQAAHTEQSRRKWVVTVTDKSSQQHSVPHGGVLNSGSRQEISMETVQQREVGGGEDTRGKPHFRPQPPPASLPSIPSEPGEPAAGAGVWRRRQQKPAAGRPTWSPRPRVGPRTATSSVSSVAT